MQALVYSLPVISAAAPSIPHLGADWRELSLLYEQADGLDAVARGSWLARLRAERHRLLPDLERMLEASRLAMRGGFLEALPILDIDDEPASSSDWRAGARVGAYRLLRQLGSGGMAEVWLAERADGAFARRVAVKLPHEHPSPSRRQSFVERFRRERDILASLDHPNIAKLHDAGVSESGQPWLALEYVDGKTITGWCDERRLDLHGRVGLFRQVLLAVQHAHANLVLHRDLKPANILVTQRGDVRLLDFGIAKLLEGEGGALDDTALTRQAGRLLTLEYASPEQIQGLALTTACDLYSLGVVLYELLCGERPYELARSSAAALEDAILYDEPRSPASKAPSVDVAAARATTPARLRKVLGGDLGAVVLHALAKRPTDRYRSAESFCADLDRWLAGLPVQATSPTVWHRTIAFVRRHALATALASGAVVAIVAAGGSAAYQAVRARDEAQRAVAAREFVFDLFKSADPNAAKNGPTSIRSVLAAGVRRSEERFRARPVLRAEILQQIGQVQARLGEKADALGTFTTVVELLRSAGDPRWVRAQVELADLHGRMGTTADAFRLLAEVEPIVERAETNPELVSSFHLNKGWLLQYEGRFADARAEMERALTAARTIAGDDGERAIDVVRGLAAVERAQSNWAAAIAHMDEAAAWTRSHPQAPINQVIGVGMEEEWTRLNAGDYRIAAELAESTAKRCRELLGELTEQCIVLLDHRVQLLLISGDRASIAAVLPSLRPAHAALSSPVRKASLAITAARAEAALGGVAAAGDWMRSLRELAEGGSDTSAPAAEKLKATLAMAECELRRGNAEAAHAWLDRFADLQARSAVPFDALRVRAAVLRGIALGLRGDDAAALRTLRDAADDADAVLGPSHTLATVYRLNMLWPLLSMGRLADGAQLLDTALPSLRLRVGGDSPLARRVEELRAQLGKAPERSPVPAPFEVFL
jgi:serine/threonine protein kinase/tetratricopeptide (TPR) repeat protein